tara:strand:- start:84 stop:497 length:414 start_codon:yes stop_codon:yes gene_type:complete
MTDLFAISDRLQAKVDSLGFDSLNEPEQYFHVLWWLEAEVNNGGFDQFFDNSAGNQADITVTALKEIGATNCADILRRACDLFPNSKPSQDRNVQQDQLCAIRDNDEEAFDALDDEFYEYPDDISGLLGKYWEVHGN